MSLDVQKISFSQRASEQLLNICSSVEKTDKPNDLAQELAKVIIDSNIAEHDTEVSFKRGAEWIKARFSKEGELVQYSHQGEGKAFFNYDRLPESSDSTNLAKYSWTTLSPTEKNTHLSITINKSTAVYGVLAGELLLCGPYKLAAGLGLTFLASKLDKRIPFTAPAALGATAALTASNALLGGVFTCATLFGSFFYLGKTADMPAIQQDFEQMYNGIAKTMQSAKDSFLKGVDSTVKDYKLLFNDLKPGIGKDFNELKKGIAEFAGEMKAGAAQMAGDLKTGFNQFGEDIGINWSDVRTGLSEMASQAGTAIEAGVKSASEAANYAFTEVGAAVERFKTELAQPSSISPTVVDETNLDTDPFDEFLDDLEDLTLSEDDLDQAASDYLKFLYKFN